MSEQVAAVRTRAASRWQSALFGLSTALMFSISPIFIRHGLQALPSPLLGVSIGMLASTLAYGLGLFFRRRRFAPGPVPVQAVLFQLLAAVLVGLSTWARWYALDMAPVGVVLALGRLNVPVVTFFSPILIGGSLERITARMWIGVGLIIAGSLILSFT